MANGGSSVALARESELGAMVIAFRPSGVGTPRVSKGRCAERPLPSTRPNAIVGRLGRNDSQQMLNARTALNIRPSRHECS